MEKRLWEIDHSYYCNEGNYYQNGCGQVYSSIDEFLSEYETADLDMNLVFRWDWREGHEEESNYNGDDYYRNGTLLIFIMGQRKGKYWWCEVSVCRADEPKVINFLEPRFNHLRKLWEPFK